MFRRKIRANFQIMCVNPVTPKYGDPSAGVAGSVVRDYTPPYHP